MAPSSGLARQCDLILIQIVQFMQIQMYKGDGVAIM